MLISPFSYVEFSGIKQLHQVYNRESLAHKRRAVTLSYFHKLWQNVRQTGVTDPSTGKNYEVKIRRNTCRGFSKCDTCELLQSLARTTKKPQKAEAYLQQYREHLQEVHDDRETLAEIARYCNTLSHTHAPMSHICVVFVQEMLCGQCTCRTVY